MAESLGDEVAQGAGAEGDDAGSGDVDGHLDPDDAGAIFDHADEFEHGDTLLVLSGWIDEHFPGAFEQVGGNDSGECHVVTP